MFEAQLEAKLKQVFEVQRVRYDLPASDDKEQETLFVDISESSNRIKDGYATAKVTGKIHMYAQGEKMPFGYFSKCIASHPDLTKDLFFYDFEENTRLHENIAERVASFVYFFSGQYDPDIGTITSVTLDVETNE